MISTVSVTLRLKAEINISSLSSASVSSVIRSSENQIPCIR